MKYELAKQLKDAGFPIKGNGSGFYDKTPQHNLIGYAPTLSELIEACGDSMFRIWVDNNHKRYGVQIEQQGIDDVVFYDSLDEAIARYWLFKNPPNFNNHG